MKTKGGELVSEENADPRPLSLMKKGGCKDLQRRPTKHVGDAKQMQPLIGPKRPDLSRPGRGNGSTSGGS